MRREPSQLHSVDVWCWPILGLLDRERHLYLRGGWLFARPADQRITAGILGLAKSSGYHMTTGPFMSIAAPNTADVARRRLGRVTGVTGVAAVVLILSAVIVGTREEPAFDSPASDVLAYYRSPYTPGAPFRSFVFTVGLITFVWFVVSLTTLLRRAEGEAPWRSNIAMISGALLVALALSGNEVAVAFRADDLNPQIARYAFDEAHVAFANGWVALGSFAVCSGWVIASTGFLPRWLGWLAIATGVGLALSRLDWTGTIWLLPYLTFWLWVLVVSFLLLRRSFRDAGRRE